MVIVSAETMYCLCYWCFYLYLPQFGCVMDAIRQIQLALNPFLLSFLAFLLLQPSQPLFRIINFVDIISRLSLRTSTKS